MNVSTAPADVDVQAKSDRDALFGEKIIKMTFFSSICISTVEQELNIMTIADQFCSRFHTLICWSDLGGWAGEG